MDGKFSARTSLSESGNYTVKATYSGRAAAAAVAVYALPAALAPIVLAALLPVAATAGTIAAEELKRLAARWR
jgi:hypothetical protein